MDKKKIGIALIVVIALMMIVVPIGTYNGIIADNEKVDSKWAQVENQLQRRSDLIPNLVESVKGYAAHEQKAIQAVSDARAKLGSAQTPVQKAEANGELSNALSRLLMITENYPNLKADKNFQELMASVEGSENRLSVARKDYNDSVQVFNSKIKTFPANIVAGMGGFTAREYFKADDTAKTTPKVQF